MRKLKLILHGTLLFLVAYLFAAWLSIQSFPKKELSRAFALTATAAGGNWQFAHRREVVDADFKAIVRPAVDFLYSSAALDAEHGPHVLQVPPIDRYFVIQFMEADTDVFAYVGSRTYGKGKALEVLITPKEYTGPTYGLETISLKTDQVWCLARFHLQDRADTSLIYAWQDQVRFVPLADWKN